ncbi:helix-turn-helix transcriptional regulator [Oceanicola sp. 502str15]|uniref:ArsR/SmtB family transcription factor n=1 Tax=Oceanicola sp. 502str15 TaxID=2696061 RepID=UPI002095307B|nr:winged helix-turn-helix domain-containing protein [Oceanicola sp. 502str15]MCO6383865.1 metalloregulator ArsR/SmtB family transcription factor [Oceanicola sp. 502str15]
MKEGPDITRIAALIGDPARANMLTALLSGKALTAGELAEEAGITPPTASGHLSKLEEAGLLWRRKQGRHAYFALAGPDVAATLEALAGLAAARGHLRTRTGPRDAALRDARICYDHIAGLAGIRIFDSLAAAGALTVNREAITLTPTGEARITALGIDLAPLKARRRPLCRACLDWSERRTHLAGGLGAAILTHATTQGWATRTEGSRHLAFSKKGASEFESAFPI